MLLIGKRPCTDLVTKRANGAADVVGQARVGFQKFWTKPVVEPEQVREHEHLAVTASSMLLTSTASCASRSSWMASTV